MKQLQFRLLELPKELLVRVLLLTGPEEFENLVLTCKECYYEADRCGLLRRHKQLQAKYKNWSCNNFRHGYESLGARSPIQNDNSDDKLCRSDDEQSTEDYYEPYDDVDEESVFETDNSPWQKGLQQFPIELINDITKDPVIKEYIKRLDLEGLHDLCETHCANEYEEEAVLRAHKAQKELRESGRLKELLRRSPYRIGNSGDLERIHDVVLTETTIMPPNRAYIGQIGVQLQFSTQILLTLLPNVTHLRPPHDHYLLGKAAPESDYDLSTRNPYCDMQNFFRSILEQSDIRSGASLAKLRIIEPLPLEADSEGTLLHSLAPLLLLPSVFRFEGCAVSADGPCHENFEWPSYCASSSTAQEIYMTGAGVSATCVGKFLERMQNVRSFQWSHTSLGKTSAGFWWDCGAFVAEMMASPIRQTLETFRLCSDEVVCILSAVGDFKGFENLTYLTIGIECLRGTPKWDTYDTEEDAINMEEDAWCKDVEPIRPLVQILPPRIKYVDITSCYPLALEAIDGLMHDFPPEPADMPQLEQVRLLVGRYERTQHWLKPVTEDSTSILWNRHSGRHRF